MSVKNLLLSLLLLASWVIPNIATQAQDFDTNLVNYAEGTSVRILLSDGSSGSGNAFTRKDWTGKKNITFIWTAAHVFQSDDDNGNMQSWYNTNTPPPIVHLIPNGQIYGIITNRAKIIQNIYNADGAVCGSTNKVARLIKFSDIDQGQDLAILVVEGDFFNTNSTKFDFSGKPFRIGTPLVTVGSPTALTDCYSEGVVANVGQVDINGNCFDQTTCVVYPGSSGSGIFNRHGVYVGMATVMKAPNVNFIIPMRRILYWAKKENIEWALNPDVPMPTESEFRKLPLFDTVAAKLP